MKRTPLKRNTPLQKSKKQRQMTPDAMFDTIQTAMLRDGRCAYADAWVWMGRGSDRWSIQAQCWGATQFHHIYKQAHLREDLFDPINGTDTAKLKAALADIRLGACACEEHHGHIESGQLDDAQVDEQTQRAFLEALEEYGLTDRWDNRQAKKVAA